MMKYIVLSLVVFLSACAGGSAHKSFTMFSQEREAKRINEGLLTMSTGMTKTEVMDVLGHPRKTEAYPWGEVFLYLTSTDSTVYDVDFGQLTPLVFVDGKLQGWGNNYYELRTKKSIATGVKIKVKEE